MFKGIFNKRKIDGKCCVLYCFNYDQNITNQLFDFLLKYFDEQVKVQFKYMGSYDEHYDNNYGKIEVMRKRIAPSKWKEILNVSLDMVDMRGSEGENESKVRIDFAITRPIEIFIVVSNDIKFSLLNFTSQFYVYFQSIYGFSYDVDINYWPTAYGITDWEHARKNPSMKELSKSDLDRWKTGCEKIQEGYFRNIFKENILSSVHLNQMVNGQRLSELIEVEHIGQLSAINEELFLWELKEEDVRKVRVFMDKSGLII